METNYDLIAEQYRRSKCQPWRTFVEAYSLTKLIGDVKGKSVVDLACGEGFYTRLMRAAGGNPVLGVDSSAGMIQLAQQQETHLQQGIQYSVQDCKQLVLDEEYDLVIAAYLLNYARSRAELALMLQSIARCLKPGGRFVTVNTNPHGSYANPQQYRKYGFSCELQGPRDEGSPILWTFFIDSGPVCVENYFIDAATHENVFEEAGFRGVRWIQPSLSPDCREGRDDSFWSLLLDQPPIVFLECRLNA